jgi:hypothetical protein
MTENDTKRYFKVLFSDSYHKQGRYDSNKGPLHAAKKAARQLFKHTRLEKITFKLKETTRLSEKKVFSYEAQITRLESPEYKVVGDSEIDILSKIKVKSI